MSLTQDPEPLEYSILDELISNLTASDDERLGLYVEDESDGYWTADDDSEPNIAPRLRTASLRGPNEPPRTSYHHPVPVRPRAQYLQVPPTLSPTASSVSSVTSSHNSVASSPTVSSVTVSSESSVSESLPASSTGSSTLVDVYEPGRHSPDTMASLSEMITALSLSPDILSPRGSEPIGGRPPGHHNGAEPSDVPFPTPDGEGKTYEIGVHMTNAWWRAVSLASDNPHTRPRKVRDDRLRQQARVAAEGRRIPNLSDIDLDTDTEAEDSSGTDETIQRSPSPSPPVSPVRSPSLTPPPSPTLSETPSSAPSSRPPSPPFDFVIPPRPYIAPRPSKNSTKYYAVTSGLAVGVFDDWLEVGPNVYGVSKAIYKTYRLRADAEAAFNRTLARGAVHVYASREEAAAEVVLPLARIIRVPRYARGNISPAHAETIVVFRGRTIGVFYDWLDCADHVLGVRGSVYNGFATHEAAWNAWFAAVREDFPYVIHD